MASGRAVWIAGLVAVLALVPAFVHSDYILTLLDLAGIYAIAVMGLGILLGFTGQMSLAQAAFLGIGAYTSGYVTTHLGWSVWVAMPLAVLLSALVGLVVGYPCLRLSGHYLALATIGFGIIAQLVLINWKDVTNGSDGMTGIPPPQIGPWVLDTYGKYYYLVLAAVLVCAYVAWRIKTTRVGRALHAIRENEIAARATGIDATRYKIVAFVLAGAYAGLAGSLLAHDIKFVSPDSYSFDQSVVFLVMLILGGSSSISGAIIGALLLTMLPEVLRPLKSSYIMVYGAAVIAMIVFMPQGLVGLFGALRARFEPRTPPRAGAPVGAPSASLSPGTPGAPGAEPA
jgi:branched-chain amino acid transport system permease protein